ncbi:MAG TPA: GFA family protein [Polyangiaceae bacterium LLY-WYZ-15_(1-7)]|nr:aldehyde-activating protein [Myxococcales bacterium]MAT27102.1 aldehyde-activating protein [Sandaracinus sp.]HJK91082.1 GFA family protein [Polyangiaceae bacterium LLY-WYZ-15_(1-7)]MBJ73212.1 aldehyde-activating protein [Sandaracinus sp.]HJL00325.1 GFA family protein [Polyangiaceae bacterium LLY-WYZ-15_(1-7)]
MSAFFLDGGCHCGALRFRVHLEAREAIECNCSICTKKGYLHLIVPADRFEVLEGDEDALETYTFGTGTAKHHFCWRCGCAPWYVPRSHPGGFDVNVRCLDEVAEQGLGDWTIAPFDGRHWEENVASIREEE